MGMSEISKGFLELPDWIIFYLLCSIQKRALSSQQRQPCGVLKHSLQHVSWLNLSGRNGVGMGGAYDLQSR